MLNGLRLGFRDFAALLLIAAVCVGVVLLGGVGWRELLAIDYRALLPKLLGA